MVLRGEYCPYSLHLDTNKDSALSYAGNVWETPLMLLWYTVPLSSVAVHAPSAFLVLFRRQFGRLQQHQVISSLKRSISKGQTTRKLGIDFSRTGLMGLTTLRSLYGTTTGVNKSKAPTLQQR